jgi:transposase
VVEESFAVDSTGFAATRFERWFDKKYGVTRQQAVWVKAHACCGIKTNVITAARVLDKDSADHTQFKPLVQATSERFGIKEVSANNENFGAVDAVGGIGYIAFKGNATGGVNRLFAKMLEYFQFQREEYLAHYHKRSNVESCFSAIKRKFGDSLMCKSEVGLINEILCHNLTCLIQEQETLGIIPLFWKNETPVELNGRAIPLQSL